MVFHCPWSTEVTSNSSVLTDGSTFEALPPGESLQALVSHGFSSQPCLSQASLCPRDFNSKSTCQNDPTCIQGFIRFLWLPIPSIISHLFCVPIIDVHNAFSICKFDQLLSGHPAQAIFCNMGHPLYVAVL